MQPNTPKLRFKEFTVEWQEKKLGDELDNFKLGGNYENSEVPNEFPLIKMGNLGRGNIVLNKIEYITLGQRIDQNDRIKLNDLFFNTRNTLELVGKVAIWKDELPTAYYNSNLMRISFPCNQFMNYYFNTYKGLKSLKRLATGTTSVAAIYTRDLLRLIIYSSSVKEQEKIAGFLGAVDEKINKLEEKKKGFEKYKKGVMQAIFSQKIRFKPDLSSESSAKLGDSHFPDWEEKKLGEIGGTYNGLIGKSAEDFGEGSPYITYMQIFGGSSVDMSKCRRVKIGEKENQNEVKKGDIFFTTSSETPEEVGFSSALLSNNETAYLNSFCFGYRLENIVKYFPEYLNIFFRSEGFRKMVIRLAQGSTRFNLSKIEMMKIAIQIPVIEEQEKIAEFLTSLDDKVDLINKQLEQAKLFKKSLLQQMFV